MTLYVFDVDGTLTRPTKHMDEATAAVFARWAGDKRYFLTSGSTLETMRCQIPPGIMEHAEGWFPCAGGEFWQSGSLTYKRSFIWPDRLFEVLQGYAHDTEYPFPGANHTENRDTMLCFAVPGRDAAPDRRRHYAEWDAEHGERRRLVQELSDRFLDLSVTIGGQISIDIAPGGMDKGQILTELRRFSSLPIAFFGDKTEPGGNDYSLAEALKAEGSIVNVVFRVTGPDDTRAMLETMEAHDCSC